MTGIGLIEVIVYFFLLLLFIKPLGWYIAQIYQGKSCGLNKFGEPIENFLYRFCHIKSQEEMDWRTYVLSMLVFNFIGLLLIYFIQRAQFYLPFNPQKFLGILPDLAFNNAASFTTNTDWQAYSGESVMSYCTQMLGFTVQNFISAATGLSLFVALTRGIARRETSNLGNFWVDTTRGILYILMPLAFVFAIFLVSQGVIQNYKPYQPITSLQTQMSLENQMRVIPMGPAASQIAIKQLGSNGGGFFNANSTHPFENPTPLTNFFEMLAILLIPASLCYTFGILVNDKKQGWAILLAMFILFLPCACASIFAERYDNPLFFNLGLAEVKNMEGKETRIGIINSALWATATTATSNGSVNAMHDSFSPLGGMVSLWLMHLGEVVFGGVGCGLYSMLMFIVITVFIAGLMVGRTPEYLGKKIEPFEMKMACFAVLVMPLIVLVFTAIAVTSPDGKSSILNPGPHGFSEILYAFSSMTNNNGSAFAGLNTHTPFYNLLGGIAILIGRYWLAIPMMAIAGSLAKKKIVPTSSGTLSTHSILFIILLVCVVTLLGALSFLPALALGPVVENLILWEHYGY